MRRARAADLFDAWMLAASEATLALAAWNAAPRGDKAGSYAVYAAALDREAQAADLLSLQVSPAAA